MARPTGQEAIILIEAEAAAYGVRRTTDAIGRTRFETTCGHCGRQAGMFNASINHVEQVLSHFRKHGWVFANKTPPYCSTQHVRDAKRSQKDARKDQEMTNFRPPPPSAASAAAMSVSAPNGLVAAAINPSPKIAKRVITLLNQQFDEDRRLYHAGWSDERVAKEADAPLEYVINNRRIAYGELAEDPEATKLRAALKRLEDKLFEQSAEIDELKARLDRLAARAHTKAQG